MKKEETINNQSWIHLFNQKIQKSMLMATTGRKGNAIMLYIIRYKKRPNDDFEWYYGYDTLKDIFVNYFDQNASISFENNNFIVLFLY